MNVNLAKLESLMYDINSYGCDDGSANIKLRTEDDMIYVHRPNIVRKTIKKAPTKEMTIEEIEKKLGYKIKVIGGE